MVRAVLWPGCGRITCVGAARSWRACRFECQRGQGVRQADHGKQRIDPRHHPDRGSHPPNATKEVGAEALINRHHAEPEQEFAGSGCLPAQEDTCTLFLGTPSDTPRLG